MITPAPSQRKAKFPGTESSIPLKLWLRAPPGLAKSAPEQGTQPCGLSGLSSGPPREPWICPVLNASSPLNLLPWLSAKLPFALTNYGALYLRDFELAPCQASRLAFGTSLHHS